MTGSAATDRAVARAIDALRRGWAVEVIAGAQRLRLLAVESADARSLADFDPASTADLLISAARAARRLARQAGILPAYFLASGEPDCEASVTAEAIDLYDGGTHLHIATRARLPVATAENSEIVAFRTPGDPREHVALIIGQRDGSIPVVRLHSECLTGDVLGSLKCDCGPQLHGAMHRIAEASWGV
ncbi:MAG: GTP cyclohydrolase II, partial [Sphingobium sp. 32-64-5]